LLNPTAVSISVMSCPQYEIGRRFLSIRNTSSRRT
jgi:hypothetical protein